MSGIKNVRHITKFKRSVKGISPVIATLLMIAITVVAALVAYAWVTGYLGFTTTKAGNAIDIPSFTTINGNLVIYVQNVGQGTVELKPDESVYVNGALVRITLPAPNPTGTITIPEGQTVELQTDSAYTGQQVDIKVTTTTGTSMTKTGKAPTPTPVPTVTPTPSPTATPTPTPTPDPTVTPTPSPTPTPTMYTVTVTDTANGDIAPKTGSYAAGSTPSFTITPSSGYYIESVTTNAGSQTVTNSAGMTYTFPALTGHDSITATYTVSDVNGFDVVTTAADPQIAGTAFSITVTAKDSLGNTITGYTGTVQFTTSDPSLSVVLPSDYTFLLSDSGAKTFTGVILVTAGSQTITVADGAISDDVSVNVAAADAESLTVSGFPSPIEAGTAGTVTVTAKDAYGNIATGYTGTVHFTSSDVQAVLPTDYTFTVGDAGTKTFTNEVTLKTAATQSISATDTVTGTITGSQTGIVVNAGSHAGFAFSTISSPQTAGTAIAGITIRAVDAYGNTVTSYASSTTLTETDGGVGGTVTQSPVTFSAGEWSGSLTLTKSGTGVTITATGGGQSGKSNTFNVNPGALHHFGFATIGTQTVGTSFSITITAYDANNNVKTDYIGNPTLTCSAGTNTINPTTIGAFALGTNTGSVRVYASGSGISITATDGAITGTSNTFTMNSAQVTFVDEGTGSGTTGNPTPTYPTGLQFNDLIILHVTVRDSNTPTTPAGFTLLHGPNTQGSTRQYIYYKFSDGTESGATLTVTIGGGSTKAAQMYAFRNVALSSFSEGGNFRSGYDDVILAQSVTTSGTLRLAVSFVFIEDNIALSDFTGESGGNWGEVSEYQYDRPSSGDDVTLQLQTATMATAGTINNGSYDTGFTNYNWGVRAFALKPI